jgi:hypothetical protein
MIVGYAHASKGSQGLIMYNQIEHIVVRFFHVLNTTMILANTQQ